MAVGSRNAVFTFKADISNYVQNGAVLVRTNNGIRKSAQDVSTTMMQQKQSMQQTSQTAASAAVNFQTMTQGMLNLSTAGAQTFTSLSNLDRAANRLMMARVAQQRGVDLLRNKELRLAQLREKGGADMRKIAALEAEVATARQDLLVKTDKLRIEEGALNDIRILFATNIANVMISSLQTINTLRQLEVKNTLMASGAKVKDIFVSRMWVQTSRAAIKTNQTMALSLKGVLTTLGPIGLAITGISVAMQAYNENWLGFKDALQSVFPFLRDLENDVLPGVKDETDALIASQERYTQSLEETNKQAKQVPNTFRKMQEEIKKTRGELIAAAVAQEMVIARQNEVNTAIQISTQINQLSRPLNSGVEKTPTKIKQRFGIPSFIQSALMMAGLFEGPGANITQEQLRNLNVTGDLALSQERMITFEQLLSDVNARMDKFVALINEQEIAAGRLPMRDIRLPNLTNLGFPINTLLTSTQEIKNLGFLADEREIPSFVNRLFRAGKEGMSMFVDIDPNKLKGIILNGVPLNPEDGLKIAMARMGFREPRDLSGSDNRTLFDFLDLHGSIGESKIFKTKFLDVLKGGDNRADVAFLTGVDIGAIANVIPKEEGMRIAQLEKQMSYFANTAGGNAAGAGLALAANGGLTISQSAFNHLAKVIPNARTLGNLLIGSGAISATQAWQVSESVNFTPTWRRQQIVIEDKNRNRLKTGGRRVLNEDGTPMYDLWDERAVEGGFTSISAYRDDWWTKFRAKGRQAESFAEMLGNETRSAATYNTASNLIASMNSTMGLLGRTGLSLSALPSRGDFMPRRAGGGIGNVGNRYFSYMASISRQHQQAVSRTIAANQMTLKRAGQIDLLIGGFGLNEYYGSGLALQQLQLAVQKQDELIQSIGLNRTEAFRIIDTQGRGRNEIEDRVRWTQRNESISTGNIVL